MRLAALLWLTALGSLSAQTPSASPAPPRHVAVRAAHLVDPKSARRIDDAVILIEGDKITAAGSRLAIPSGYEVIDLGSSTVLPGLIDVHTHLPSWNWDYYEGLFRRSPVDAAILAHLNAQRLSAGGLEINLRSIDADAPAIVLPAPTREPAA